MSNADRQRLEELRAAEEAAFSAARDWANPNPEPGEQNTRLARAWWSAAAALVHEYLRQYEAGQSPDIPIRAIRRLANNAWALSTGNEPEPVRFATARDGRRMWPWERKQIAAAIFYLDAVEAGQVDDPSPVLTVADAYGVTRRAVQKWRKRRSEICVGVDAPNPGSVELVMAAAGQRYRHAGRGTGGAGERDER